MLDSATNPSRTTGFLLLFATVLYGLAARGDVIANAMILAATATLAVACFRLQPTESHPFQDADRLFEKSLLVAVVLFGILGANGWAPLGIVSTTGPLGWMPGLIWSLLAVGLYVTKGGDLGRRGKLLLMGVTLGITLIVGLLHLREVFDVGIDVVFLHASAADALAAGENPYTDAVSVFNGAPTAEPGDVIEGYPYPPITALAYSAGSWLFSDPRYTSLIAWLVFLVILGWRAVRAPTRHGLYVMLLMASMPGWPYVLRASWTEPLSLAFISAGLVLWAKPARSGSLFGFALASKQYFAVTAPLFLFGRGDRPMKRAGTAATVIAVTIGAGLVWDASAFWNAVVEFHTTNPPREDSLNLVGLIAALFGEVWGPPTLLTAGLGLLIAFLIARRSRTAHTFMMGMAITLAVSFLVASQAFVNYWFLTAGICGLALLSLPFAPPPKPVSYQGQATGSPGL